MISGITPACSSDSVLVEHLSRCVPSAEQLSLNLRGVGDQLHRLEAGLESLLQRSGRFTEHVYGVERNLVKKKDKK